MPRQGPTMNITINVHKSSDGEDAGYDERDSEPRNSAKRKLKPADLENDPYRNSSDDWADWL